MEALAPIELRLDEGLRFSIDFGLAGVASLHTDARPPLGGATGPDSEMLLMAAVANCLAGSLAFFLRKFQNPQVPMRASAGAQLVPNENGRPRVTGIAVDIHLGAAAASIRMLERALSQYQDFCVVTQSVRASIPVTVRVFDAEGALLAAGA
jgi:organic hydroperoxide reductase OsmC/OhrA